MANPTMPNTLANTDWRTRTLFIVHVLHHDGTIATVRVRAHSVHGAYLQALNGGTCEEAEVCNTHNQQLAIYGNTDCDDSDSDTCPECERSYGPHYRGPCEH